MSLLGSIFGREDNQKVEKTKSKKGQKIKIPDDSTDLFAKSAQLPERPSHEPAPPRKEKRKQEVEEPPKKRRKPRKTPDELAEETKQKDEEQAESSTEKLDDGGDDEDDVEARTIFVGNVPLQGASRKSLAALFKDCGAIESARIRSVPVKGIKLPPQRAGDQNLMKKVCVNTNQLDYENSMKETVMGYVVFKNEESVSKALELNNVLIVEGRRIRVDRASPSVEPSRSVFIGNLPYAADEMTLQDHFLKGCAFEVGDVEGVRIIRDKETYQCKGFGYILLKEKSMIPTALKLHDSVYMKKKIRVLVCGKRFKNKKGLVAASKVTRTPDVTGTATAPKETVTVGAFRRILAKQSKDVAKITKRKRGEKKKTSVAKKGGPPGVSKRAVLEKKVEKRVKKIQKRISKGMGKTRR
jgi:nucleolar protein 12